jgi:hypothetical protein
MDNEQVNIADNTSISRFLLGFLVAILISLPWLALMYAGQQIIGAPHVPFELFEFLTRILPGGLISLGIEWLIQFVSFLRLGQTSSSGKSVEIFSAYLLALVLLSLLGGLYAVSLQRLKTPWEIRGVLAGLILTIFTILLASWGGWGGTGTLTSVIWLLVIGLTWGVVLAWGVDRLLLSISQPTDSTRNRVLGELAVGSLVITGLAVGLGRWLIPQSRPQEITGTSFTPQPTAIPPTGPPPKAGFEPVPGTRPEITPIEDFYRVDINLLPPGDAEFLDSADPFVQRLLEQGGETDLPADTYILIVDGLVKNPLALSLEDLKSYPPVEHFATLECISNPVGGDLISTTLFQGVRLREVLETAELDPTVIDIKFTCVDGYSESLPLEAALHPETLLCHSMGNQPLTKNHGAPLRLYTPDRFGIKNPKWIIKIEAIDTDYLGFWQQRGWSESGFIKTTTVIDTIQTDSEAQTLIGGIAFAGARGIESVEFRVDQGPWVTAETDRPLSQLTWVLWRASVDLPPGEHEITVRAIDSQGEVQTEKQSRTHPNGATGYHSKKINI